MKNGLLKDRTDFGGLVNERPEPSRKGSPDTNIDKNGGILIDRDTLGKSNNTSNTTPSFTKNKNTIDPNTLNGVIIKNGEKP